MTISEAAIKSLSQGNGVTTVFAIPFTIIEDGSSEVEVVLRDESVTPAVETVQVEITNYTLTGGPPPTNVTMVVAPASTEKLLIRRIVALEQQTDYLENGDFPAESHETALDKLTAAVQQLREALDRAPVLPDTTTIVGNLRLEEPEADTVIGWDSAGTALTNIDPDEFVSLGSGALQLALNLSDLSNVATALINLGISPYGLQVSDTVNDAEAGPTDITGWTLDASTFTSGVYAVEISRSSSAGDQFVNLDVTLQRVAGAWRIEFGPTKGDISSSKPAGVTLTVGESGGIAQVKYASDTLGGTGYVGTVKFKKLTFAP